jgi:hypothetical protein
MKGWQLAVGDGNPSKRSGPVDPANCQLSLSPLSPRRIALARFGGALGDGGRGIAAAGFASFFGGRLGVTREGSGGGGGARLVFQCAFAGAGAPRIGAAAGVGAVLGGLAAHAGARSRAWLRANARAARFGQSNGDGLLGVSCAVLALADVLHLFADELTRLGRGALTLRASPLGLRYRCFCRHARADSNKLAKRRGRGAVRPLPAVDGDSESAACVDGG